MRKPRGRGALITFEGGEGAGKSTQARLLAEHLQGLGVPTLLVREPGGTALGESLRRVLLESEGVDPLAEALVFLAARAEARFRVVDAGRPLEDVSRQVRAAALSLLERSGVTTA